MRVRQAQRWLLPSPPTGGLLRTSLLRTSRLVRARVSTAGTSELWPSMASWIFQCPPAELDGWLRDVTDGGGFFPVTKYKQRIAAGDIVYLWASGRQAGIYAFTHTVTRPGPPPGEMVIHGDVDWSANSTWVGLGPISRLSRPLLKTQLQADDMLRDLLVIRAPWGGANHEVTDEQGSRLARLVEAIGAPQSASVGLPHDAFVFLRELDAADSVEWWNANKDRFELSVRGPFWQLASAVRRALIQHVDQQIHPHQPQIRGLKRRSATTWSGDTRRFDTTVHAWFSRLESPYGHQSRLFLELTPEILHWGFSTWVVPESDRASLRSGLRRHHAAVWEHIQPIADPLWWTTSRNDQDRGRSQLASSRAMERWARGELPEVGIGLSPDHDGPLLEHPDLWERIAWDLSHLASLASLAWGDSQSLTRVAGRPIAVAPDVAVKTTIFISYRRDDAPDPARILSLSLAEPFGQANVFMDVDTISAGSDFERELDQALGSCAALLAVIGPNWLTVRDDRGERRLDDPGDFVVREIATALGRGITVIPVLVHGAKIPSRDDLPPALLPLAKRQARSLTHVGWRSEIKALVGELTEIMQHSG
jgi:hypothetical protein